ncbi:MAG TPA: hypothetical protein VFZ09_33445 [Archangium sp.]|uniref:hypothetical protein n=1 Tax=Archangium sp. TaxID=1872627 RepID=UPI002E374D23|nr:hypothetical protein [Archangium sp.]HEX5751177.1 hypothetical protein [Archangium sp.]
MGSRGPGEHEERPSAFLGVLRCLVAMVTSGLGLGLGAWLGLYAVGALDEMLGEPMGGSGDFLHFGHLTLLCTVLAAPLGAVFGAFGGHALLAGRGSLWAGLGALLVGLAPILLVSLMLRGLALPMLLLLPVVVAVGLELGHGARVRGGGE